MEEQHFQSQYAVIPAEVIYDREITMSDKLLYGVISNLCNHVGYCWATNAYLGSVVDLKKDSISKGIARLKNAGYIVDFYVNVDGKSQRRIKVCTSFKILGLDKNPNPIGLKSDTPSDILAATPYKVKKESKTLKQSDSELQVWPTFQDFWELGLPKADKERAERYWNKVSQTDRELIMIHAPQYIDSVDDKRFLKQAPTYLNQKAWKNEIIDRRNATNIAAGALAKGANGITAEATLERLSSYSD